MTIELETGGVFSDGLSVDAIYTPYGGASVEIHVALVGGEHGSRPDSIISACGVHILPVERDLRVDFRGGSARQIGTAYVKASDVSAPGYLDTIEVDGVTWTVNEVYDYA